MAEALPQRPAFCLVLHDVAPSTWPAYREFVGEMDRQGGIPLTLLVVPDFHRQGPLDRFPAFTADIERRLCRGDEVVLHGYHHDDGSPRRLAAAEWFMRRVYTREGEFYGLAEQEAVERLCEGADLFRRLGWPVRGFVPPAWLLGSGTRDALRRFDFSYTSSLHGLIRLPGFRFERAPTLVWSARSAWRRGLSRLWNDRMRRRWCAAPLIRIGLHPIDMLHWPVYRYWVETVRGLLRTRTPLTKSAWLDRLG